MKSKPEIVVIGAAIVDLPLYPVGRDVFDRASSPVERMAMTVGGDAINEATILTRLGHTVRLVSAVGQDPAGSFVLEHCRKNKIDSSFIAVSHQRPADQPGRRALRHHQPQRKPLAALSG